MKGATRQAERGNAYRRLHNACETENPEDSKFGLDESSGSREDRKSPNPTGSGLLPSSSTLCIIAILFSAATVSAACKLPGGVTKKINWVYMMFCLTNTFSFYSSLSVFPILLLGQLDGNFRVAAVKASYRMLQLSVISMMMAYCSGRSLVLEGHWVVFYIRAMGVIGVIAVVVMSFPSFILRKLQWET